MKNISKEFISYFPVINNLKEANEKVINLLEYENEEVIYAFMNKKRNMCNQFIFTTHKLIILDRLPNNRTKIGRNIQTGWDSHLEIPYKFLRNVEIIKNRILFFQTDISIVYNNHEAFLASKDGDIFIDLVTKIENNIFKF